MTVNQVVVGKQSQLMKRLYPETLFVSKLGTKRRLQHSQISTATSQNILISYRNDKIPFIFHLWVLLNFVLLNTKESDDSRGDLDSILD